MRDPLEILAELEAARADYHEAAGVETAPELAARSQAIKGLMEDFSASICDGAKPCADCVGPVQGRLYAREQSTGKRFVANVFEVFCQAVTGPIHARAGTVAEAVAKWNRGDRSSG